MNHADVIDGLTALAIFLTLCVMLGHADHIDHAVMILRRELWP